MRPSVFSMHRPAPFNRNTGGPLQTPVASDQPPIAAQLRRKLLDALLIAFAIAAGVLYLVTVPSAITYGQWLDLVVYGLVITGLWALIAARQMVYLQRAASFLTLLLIGAGYMLFSQGLPGSGRVLLLLFPWLTVMLLAEGRFQRWLRLLALGLSILILALAGGLALRGSLPAGAAGSSGSAWLAAWLGFGLAAVIGTTAFDFYLRGLESHLDESQETIARIEQERQHLEMQITQNVSELDRRLVQLRTAAEITQSISKTLDLNRLLVQVCDLVKARLDLYYVGVFLVAPGSDEAVLAAGTGPEGQAMVAAGHRLKIGGDSMIGWATAQRQARIALDTGLEAVRFDNPYLPQTRSELALPIISQEALLGALTIQSEEEAAFDQDDILVLQGVADSLAGAIENARLFSQIQSNLQEITNLQRQQVRRAWMEVLEASGPQEYEYTTQSEKAATAPVQTYQIAIRLREEAIGSLILETEQPMDAAQLSLIETVLSQAAFALENARLLEETRQQADREAVAAKISSRIWSSTDINAILQTALRELGSSLDVVEGTIELWPEPLAQAESPIDQDSLNDLFRSG